MKKRIFIAILMVITAALFAVCTSCTDGYGSNKSERWEYKTVEFNAEFNPEYNVEYFEEELNKLGSDGWEYSFYLQGFGWVFKRKLP